MEEILVGVRDSELSIEEATEIICSLTNNENTSGIAPLLKLVSKNIMTVEKASNMINKLIYDENTVSNREGNTSSKSKSEDKRKNKKKRRAARPLEKEEFNKILSLCKTGFRYKKDGVDRVFRPNKQLAMAFLMQANLGLRISDVLKLKPSTFKNEKLEVIEKKTGKLQYRDINRNLKDIIYEYAMENSIQKDENLIQISRVAIHKQLKIITDYLGYTNISSHSFRKFYGVVVYETTGGDIELLKELFNHADVSTTQRYIRVSREKINKVSSEVDFTEAWNV